VSVLMTVYRGDIPDFVETAIESILHQTYREFEFVIIADGPLQPSLVAIIQRFTATDARIRYDSLETNRGQACALNAGLRMARGEFIVRMDADDISREDRIELLLQFMDANPTTDIAGSYIREFQTSTGTSHAHTIAYPCTHELMRQHFAKRNPLAHPSVIFRRRFVQAAGDYSICSSMNEDTLLWLSGFMSGCRFGNVPEPLLFFRFDKRTGRRRTGLRKAFFDFSDRLRVIDNLGGGFRAVLLALAVFFVQLTPAPLYYAIRKAALPRTCSVAQTRSSYIWKRLLDVVLAGTALLAFLPLFLLIAFAVKVDSRGPVIYRGRRVGRGMRPFYVLKFRSMVHDAELLGGSATSDLDPRITRVGRFLRKWKLDELPQLVNVLVGQMSLVGPRPDVEKYAQMLTGAQKNVLSLRPGLTDWASIWDSDEGLTLAHYDDAERAYQDRIWPIKVALQMKYQSEVSLWTDLKIIAFTCVRLARRRWLPRELRDPVLAGTPLRMGTTYPGVESFPSGLINHKERI